MFEWMFMPDAWVALATLLALEIVLGIDNINFITILVSRLPAEQRDLARSLGIGFAMLSRLALLFSLAWIIGMVDSVQITAVGLVQHVSVMVIAIIGAVIVMKKNDALVAVSTGLLQNMSKDEVEAVLAHEISHVACGDMVTLALIQGVLNTFVILLSRLAANVINNFMSGDEEGEGLGFFGYMAVTICTGDSIWTFCLDYRDVVFKKEGVHS